MKEKVFSIFLFLLLFAPPALAADRPYLKKAAFIPHWSPQAQFAGYYVAYEKGLYRKHGLDLTIIPGGPAHSPIDYLRQKKADFGSLWLCSAIEKRGQGLNLINIAQIMQKSALMLVAKKESGIRTLQDMNGKKVGLWRNEFQIQPRSLFKKYNLKVRIIPQSFSVNLFLQGGVDVASAMWYNEFHTLLNSGLNPDELSTFFFFDYELNFPEDGLYCLEETLQKDPEMVGAFVRASLEGWHYAFSHPEEALDIILKHMRLAGIPANRVHQRWMLARMKDLIIDSGNKDSLGRLKEGDYLQVAGELKKIGLIKEVPYFTSFYHDRIDHAQK